MKGSPWVLEQSQRAHWLLGRMGEKSTELLRPSSMRDEEGVAHVVAEKWLSSDLMHVILCASSWGPAMEVGLRRAKGQTREWLLGFLTEFNKIRSSVRKYLAHTKGLLLIYVFWNQGTFSLEILVLPKRPCRPGYCATSGDWAMNKDVWSCCAGRALTCRTPTLYQCSSLGFLAFLQPYITPGHWEECPAWRPRCQGLSLCHLGIF